MPENTDKVSLVRREVGLLFVHGIGRQRHGQTILEAGSALLSYLGYSPARGESDPEYEVHLGTVSLVGGEPAYADVSVRVSQGKQTSSWLVAESHWAESFIPPSIGPTLRWIVFKSPAMFLFRAGRSMRAAWLAWWNRPQNWWRLAIQLVWTILVVPMMLVVVTSLTILVLLRTLIPLEWLKSLLTRVEGILTSFVGDSYLFAESPLSGQAMATIVARDIAWIRERSKKVIVVAHSQGAAVAAQALDQLDPIHAFVTFGAGVDQLAWLRARRGWLNGVVVSVFWLFGIVLLSWLVYSLINVFSGHPMSRGLWLVLMFLWPLVLSAIGAVVISLRDSVTRNPGHLSDRVLAKTWLDVWASSDPVPGGPSTASDYVGVKSIRVWNHGDLLRDHTGYFRNSAEFVGRIAQLAMGASSTNVSLRNHAKRLGDQTDVLSDLRQRRGRWLESCRAAIVVLAVGAIWRFTLPVQSALGAALADLHDQFPPVPDLTGSVLGIPYVQLIAVFSILLAVVALYYVAVLHWWAWGGVEEAAVRSKLTPASRQGSTPMLIAFSTTFFGVLLASVMVFAVGVRELAIVANQSGQLLVTATVVAVPSALLFWAFRAPLRRIHVAGGRTAAQTTGALALSLAVWMTIWLVIVHSAGIDLDNASKVTLVWVYLSFPVIWLAALISSSFTSRVARFAIKDPSTYRPFKYVLQASKPGMAAIAGWGLVGVLAFQLTAAAVVTQVHGTARFWLTVIALGLILPGALLAATVSEDSRSGWGVVSAWVGVLIGIAAGVLIVVLGISSATEVDAGAHFVTEFVKRTSA